MNLFIRLIKCVSADLTAPINWLVIIRTKTQPEKFVGLLWSLIDFTLFISPVFWFGAHIHKAGRSIQDRTCGCFCLFVCF